MSTGLHSQSFELYVLFKCDTELCWSLMLLSQNDCEYQMLACSVSDVAKDWEFL